MKQIKLRDFVLSKYWMEQIKLIDYIIPSVNELIGVHTSITFN